MDVYQALARTYRPRRFSEVLGQDALVTTLTNALQGGRIAHAYLFSGPRGTGKTTIARILAKALNCTQRDGVDPCDACASCRDITHGSSLDVLEIDGASHRGIDDIRQINETVGYAASGGGNKIYIVDEVHMLTKEAFNALLKTLEEPPKNVKFFFATTEPQKVPATIVSRCQRFQLSRISNELIVEKLQREAKDLGVEIEPAALELIADAANGGMRDAESILDQVISFHGKQIDEASVAEVLGIASRALFARLDEAAREGDLRVPFAIAEELVRGGKDLVEFLKGLIEHYRQLLLEHLEGNGSEIFTKDELLALLDDLMEVQAKLRQLPAMRVAIEMAMTRAVRSKQSVPIETVVQRLIDLEGRVLATTQAPEPKKAKTMKRPQSHYDTVLRFAAVELEGRVER